MPEGKKVPGFAGIATSNGLIPGTGNGYVVGLLVSPNTNGGDVVIHDGSAGGRVVVPAITFDDDPLTPIMFHFPVGLHVPNGAYVLMGTNVASVIVFWE